jgi:lipoate-protein ligase A
MDSPSREWRLLDTAVSTAARNMALDEAILVARSEGLVPSTLRFLQFSPPAALVGVYQRVEEELRLEYCRDEGVEMNRRLTGGGAIYFDETQLGWEIVGSPGDVGGLPSADLFGRLCAPVVAALRALGLNASFRPRNDIEVGGRKISGTGGTAEGSAFLFQGTLLTDFDVDTMLRVLRVPVEKLKRKEIDSLRERVTCLRWELGAVPPLDELKEILAREFERAFGVRLVPGPLSPFERERVGARLAYFSSDSWILGERLPRSRKDYLRGYARVGSGVLKASVTYDRARESVEYVVFSGDFFAFPVRSVYDLEAALKGVAPDEVGPTVERFIAETGADFAGLGPAEFASAVEDALGRVEYERYGVPAEDVNSVFSIGEPMSRVAAIGATAVLLPYCAKPLDCDLRFTEECTECGRCDIGAAYALAREVGVEVRTITSFEHLMATLADMKARGVPAFVGSCCEAFYLKHRGDMERHGVPGVLVDVGSDTCYDLGRTREAYVGAFEGVTTIRPALLERVVRACAAKRPGPVEERSG